MYQKIRLNNQTRERVVTLKRQGYTYRAIKERLEEEGITVTIKTLYLLMAKYKKWNTVADMPRAKRKKLLNDEHYRFIDNALAEDDELKLVEKYPELSSNVSLSTVKRARYELGWVVSCPKY